MKRTAFAAAAVLFTGLTACSDQMVPTQPSHSASGSVANASKGGGSDRSISLMDACDHASFAAQEIDCARNGGVSFSQFIAEVQAHGSAGAWHMAPGTLNAPADTPLDVMNRGGEVHTFTEVKHFGGGIVPILNQLSGNPIPAPECLALEDDDFVPPGGVYHDAVDDGTTLYQCCIHPWMRTVVTGTKG